MNIIKAAYLAFYHVLLVQMQLIVCLLIIKWVYQDNFITPLQNKCNIANTPAKPVLLLQTVFHVVMMLKIEMVLVDVNANQDSMKMAKYVDLV